MYTLENVEILYVKMIAFLSEDLSTELLFKMSYML